MNNVDTRATIDDYRIRLKRLAAQATAIRAASALVAETMTAQNVTDVQAAITAAANAIDASAAGVP